MISAFFIILDLQSGHKFAHVAYWKIVAQSTDYFSNNINSIFKKICIMIS